MAPRRVLLIGLDAFDRDLADELAARGCLPNLSALADRADVADLVNPYGFLTGPVWPTIVTGADMVEHRNWTWRQLIPGTYRKRYFGANDGPSEVPPFWVPLSAEGVTCSIVDVPRFALRPETNGHHVVAFGQHDGPGLDGFAASPASLADSIAATFEIDEDRCDEHRIAGTYVELWEELCRDIDRKLALLDELWSGEAEDLRVVVFPEAHCAGHQFWDDGSAEEGPPDHLLGDIYERLDAAVGQLVDRYADDDTAVLVVMSHGMGTVKPVSRLLPPLLEAIDDELGRAGIVRRGRAFVERLPNRVARAALRGAGRDIEVLDHWVDSSRRFFPISVFPTFGAIRLNLAGREPRGVVAASAKDEVLARLEAELLALRDLDTGLPLVERVERIEDHHSTPVDIGLPDLLFEWAITDRVVRGATSPSLGEVTAEPENLRHGNHLRDGRLLTAVPGADATRSPSVRAQDVAPIVAALLGRRLPGTDDDTDGAADIVGDALTARP